MSILDVTLDRVDRVYSGRPGCGCGCRGEYYSAADSPRMVKKVINKFQRLEREKPGSFSESSVEGDFPRIGAQETNDGTIFYWETEARYYWIYLKGTK